MKKVDDEKISILTRYAILKILTKFSIENPAFFSVENLALILVRSQKKSRKKLECSQNVQSELQLFRG